jgi:hypothetical protein
MGKRFASRHLTFRQFWRPHLSIFEFPAGRTVWVISSVKRSISTLTNLPAVPKQSVPKVGGAIRRKDASMALNYAKLFNRRVTPQSRPIPGSTQVANSGGGYSWQVDDWTRFDRFLILGAEGGTYYITERDLVKQNHDAIVRCI